MTKCKTVAETSISQTAASCFHLPETLNWQSEFIQSRWIAPPFERQIKTTLSEMIASTNVQKVSIDDAKSNCFRPFPSRGGVVTNELIDKIRSQIGD